MIRLIDNFLNRITMYRLVLYFLIVLLLVSTALSVFHLLPFDPIYVVLGSVFLFFFSGFVNDIFSKIFSAPANVESTYITALILALIITPAKSLNDYLFFAIVSVLSVASKYLFAINKKHIFNPVAVAVVISSFGLGQSATWWIGNLYLLPFVVIGGYLVVRKTQRESLVVSFLLSAILTISFFSILRGSDVLFVLDKVVLHTALFFFATIMITEPLTMPPTTKLQIFYGIILGIIYSQDIHVFSIYSTPELTLLVGNIYSYLVSPKEKLFLRIAEKIKMSADTYDFIFPLKKQLSFLPGQYMELTLAHPNGDDRGNRRYFTLASSPTENNVRFGIKFYNPSSSYKKTLLNITKDDTVVASQIAGNFTLPENTQTKLVLMAGGIGITPFRSMIKYLIDRNERRDIVIFYSNKYESEIVYKNIFDEARIKLNIKTIYTLTDTTQVPADWSGKVGRINPAMIKEEIPDFAERIFYLSGPHSMVTGFEDVLVQMGVTKIKTDFFPGFV